MLISVSPDLPLDIWKTVSQLLPVESVLSLSRINSILHRALFDLLIDRRDEVLSIWESKNRIHKKKGKEKNAATAVLVHLRSLTIRYEKLSKEEMAGFIARSPNITTLSLSKSKIKFSPIYNVLRDFHLLLSLDLTKTKISDSHLLGLGNLTSLTSLNLSLNKGIKALSQIPTTLTSLNLSKTQINDEVTVHLSRLTSLVILNLSWAGDRIPGSRYISGSHYIHWPTSLTELNIRHTYIDPDVKDDIQLHLSQLKKLEYCTPEYWVM